MKHTLSVLVEDKPGVLARVAALFARRGFNIHSLAVGPIHETGRSRITLVVDADQTEQITKQLHKLVNIIKVTEFGMDESVEREIMLVRINADAAKRREALDAAQAFGCRAVDVGVNSITFEVVGHPGKLAAFLNIMRPFGVIDLVKSGRVAMARDGKAEPRSS
jgi:acetolactate synthase-1/3 small subunit